MGTFEQAKENCKDSGLLDDIFYDFPKLTDRALDTSIWSISQFNLANSTRKFFENRKKARTGSRNLLATPQKNPKTKDFQIFLEIWTGYRRVNSSHFGLRNHYIPLDAFGQKFEISRFGMVPYICMSILRLLTLQTSIILVGYYIYVYDRVYFKRHFRRAAIFLRNIRTLKAIGRIDNRLEMNNKFGMLAEMGLQINA